MAPSLEDSVPTLGLGRVFIYLSSFRISFLGSASGLLLIGWRAADISSMRYKYRRLKCALLAYAYAGRGGPTLNFIECFDFGRYKRFYCVRSNYARENLSLRRRSRESSRMTFRAELSRVLATSVQIMSNCFA